MFSVQTPLVRLPVICIESVAVSCLKLIWVPGVLTGVDGTDETVPYPSTASRSKNFISK
jgi:hypothetical protein